MIGICWLIFLWFTLCARTRTLHTLARAFVGAGQPLSRVRSRFAAMKWCSLCWCVLSEDSSKRRRLHGTSSSLALQVFVDVSSQCGHQGVSRTDQGANGLFLCIPCSSQLEKLSKVKTNLSHLTEAVTRKINATAVQLGLTARSGSYPDLVKFMIKLSWVYQLTKQEQIYKYAIYNNSDHRQESVSQGGTLRRERDVPQYY